MKIWQWSQREIRLIVFFCSTIPQKQFIIMTMTRIFNFSNCEELWLIITIWHISSAEASHCHKMNFFRNSIRNAPYSAPNFIEWFIVKDLDIRNVKYCGSHFKFCFFIKKRKTKKTIFLEVTMTIIGENT